MNAGQKARRVAREAGDNRVLTTVARVGFAASGLMHLLMGYLAIQIALHRGGESDQSGAFAQMNKLPGGMLLLWTAVIGLTALALWLLLQAALGIGSTSKKRWVRSLVSCGKAVAYLALAATALSAALRQPTNSATSTRQASGSILTLPGGQALLIVLGIATVGIGGYFVYKGARKKFHEDIALPAGGSGKAIDVLGVTGYIAKGIAIIAIGILFVVAAIKLDPKDASGLDGALKALAALPYGEAILILIGVGLSAYGVYSFARARLARL
ncbi:DUF1206 domain-containing protein [Arthrobacter glacialis]|uniref:DUF1206 domain-containing protein n=1 Tax=Arthrobacter glacialis TaxID=1664 RepID=A0A2S3ZU71_ARTGL|nr:DUF1206 domain-containing protein [Arthrobacter glacialis]POH57844.1 hypothetical protein CVS28_13830 [Arthrobacter glacialis]POH72644.1 hypothetical protein CVS27_14835 [Arthrobacter glacialis]